MKRKLMQLRRDSPRQYSKPHAGFEIPLVSQYRCEVKLLPIVL